MNRDIHHFWELLRVMTEKELRARYKYTVFGFLWMVANPVLQMIIIGFVFTFFVKEPIQHYYYFLFIGLLVWNFFSLSLSKTTPVIVYERTLIKKAKFPHAVIPLSIILSNLTHFGIALLLYIFPVLTIGTMKPESILLIIAAFTILLPFTVGLCLLTSALNVRFRDVNFFVQAILIMWFYATPIIYSLIQIPKDMLWLWRFNPLTSVLQLFQHAFLNLPMPGPAMLTSNILVTIIILVCGIYVFNKESKTFDDWV